MKSEEMQKLIDSGKVVCVATYHTGKLDSARMRDSKTGNARTAYLERHIVLTDGDAMSVTRWLQDGEEQKFVMPAKRGQRVIVTVSRMETQNGASSLMGVIEPLT